ncbi:putative c5a peptidase [Streptococcus canis]|nr:putative c5a peptidase [Streptococcus canis]
MKNHKRYKMLGISLVTTSVLLMYTANVRAEENMQDLTLVTTAEVVAPSESTAELDSANQTELSALDSQLDGEEELASPKEEAQTSYTELPQAYKDGQEAKAQTLLSQYDATNVQDLQKVTALGAGQLISVIDFGFDINHSAFKLDQDIDKKQIIDEASFEALKQKNKITYGQRINDKILFAYDYSNNQNIVGPIDKSTISKEELEHINHGTHVVGIVAANSTQVANNNLLVTGMAPNAQLLLMRISSLGKAKDQTSKAYAKAITDSVLLGAKVISMSFGIPADSWATVHEDVKKAIQLAKDHGVLLVAGIGNDGAFGKEFGKPLATNPDFGLVSSPAISEDVLTVANHDAQMSVSEVVTLKTGEKEIDLPIMLSKSLDANKAYDFTLVDEENDHLDLTGKIAVLKRSGSVRLVDFTPKIETIQKAGAAGLLVINNNPIQSNILIPYRELPVGVISQADGQTLLNNASGKLHFKHIFKVIENAGGNRMVPESSWGLTAEGHIKPDISAPGFEVLSTFSNDKYETLSGTSMSTPHVSGIMSLLQAALVKKYAHLNLTPAQLLDLTKKVAMSSASALFDPEEKAFYSPRQQGAGAINAKKALEASHYLTDADHHAKINLGNVKDTFNFTVRIHNLTKETKELYYQTNLTTDQITEDKFALKARSLSDSAWQKVTVSGDYTDVTISIDASQFSQELLQQMPNGYFLEGFVRFKDSQSSSEELMSIPFLGFRGDFANLPALEESIYSKLKTGTFYYTPVTDGLENQLDFASAGLSFEEVLNNNNSYTALLTEATPWFLSNDIKNGNFELSPYGASEVPKPIVLGTFAKQVNNEEHYTLDLNQNSQVYLAISPNKDQNRDSITPQATFLRNVKDVQAQVLDTNGNIIWSSEVAAAYIKNYTNNGKDSDGSYKLEKLVWDGTDNNQMTVADGNYIYRLLYSPVVEGARQQMMDFSVIVSTKVPNLPTRAHYDTETGQLRVEESNHQNGLPIYRTFVAFDYEDATEESLSGETVEGENPQVTEASEEDLLDMPFKYSVYFYADENGYINIPKTIKSEDGKDITIDFEKLVFVIEDKAGNFNSIKLSELLKQSQTDKQPDLKEQDELALPEMPETAEKEESSKPEQRQAMTREVTKTAELLASKKPISHLSTQQSLPQTSDRKGNLSTILGSLLILTVSCFGFRKKQKED